MTRRRCDFGECTYPATRSELADRGESSWGAWRLLALESKDGVHADRADSWEADDQAVFG
jgi:hypothetical protein